MAEHRYRVIGLCEVGDVAPGGIVVLDDAKTNIPVLLASGHIEAIEEDGPSEPTGSPRKPAKASGRAHGAGDR